MINQKRPVNLAITSMSFPPMAIASILHRLSGIALFLGTPLLFFALHLSLFSEESFDHVKVLLTQPLWKLATWTYLSALIYHFFAGFRHMIMDLGYGEGLTAGKWSAITVIILTILLSLLLGFYLW